ncbi:restriction endonuclease subunit S [Shewanella baltica]|uniref:restriction endonuclease subunit S n=1 Tax=Shewanella baltica TaxID=62322 RepID=UPI00217D7DE0|nr:restriction endonuclease subunit S [Shewanella baltica]MCS6230968.1 restriction endonuclease subunit S [Shewanella baltica]
MDKTIGLACNILTGKLDANQAVTGGEYPFFTCAEYPDQIDHFTYDDDVVLVAGNNARGNFHVSRYKGKFNAYQRTYILTAKKGFNIDYVYYALKLELKRLREKSQGSQTKFLTMPILTGIHFRDITGDEQTEIANVLSAIDKKIELNNRINAELESMAKTLYDYWFVQFDFPDDSPQGQGKPYKTSSGKMVYNPTLKREIPKGWEVDTLSSWIKSDKTGDWGKEEQEGNYTIQVDCIRGADINGLNGNGKINAPNRFILRKNDHKLLAPFDFVIEISGGSPTQSTGRMAYITDDVLNRFPHPLICSNFCKAISLHNKDLFYCFAYLWGNLYDNGILFGWEGKTSGIKNLLFDAFVTKYYVAVPPVHLAKQFFDFVAPLEQKKQSLLKESSKLETLRDWLLPMLMNGQVTVK